ncbi:MAG: hypothetical protein LQ346_006145 [Caloplaca aetnensis]|nr:MAG: hypothetical protein LQ346_006145 [Caloplaca aetnensis]
MRLLLTCLQSLTRRKSAFTPAVAVATATYSFNTRLASTLEVHDNPYIYQDGRLVTIEPFAPNKRTGFLVLFETDRRREEGWQATGYGDELPGIESDSGGSSIVETLPAAWQASRNKTVRVKGANGVNTTITNKRKRKVTPAPPYATRRTRAQAKLANAVSTPAMTKRIRKSTSPRTGTPNVLGDDEDGKCFHATLPAIC